jgi:hypothetical protein
MYKQLPDNLFGPVKTILRLSDNACIPFDPANTDYQEYLKWVSEGGVPEPADQPE